MSLALLLAATLAIAPPTTVSTAVPGACGRAGATESAGYYDIELVPTGRVPEARAATGFASVTSAPSPFGIALTADGAYRQQLTVRVDGVQASVPGYLAVWATTTEIDQVRLLGVLRPGGELVGEVSWNKFLVVVTLEPTVPVEGDSWTGAIVLRGASRSGRMHTMAGHGPFEAEPCVKYGY